MDHSDERIFKVKCAIASNSCGQIAQSDCPNKNRSLNKAIERPSKRILPCYRARWFITFWCVVDSSFVHPIVQTPPWPRVRSKISYPGHRSAIRLDMGISFRPGHRLVDPFRQRQRIVLFHPAIISIGPDGFIQGIGCPIRLDVKAEYMLPPLAKNRG